MKRNGQTHSERSIRTFLLFCLVVGTLIAGSLLYRAVLIIRDSQYISSQQFILSISEKNLRPVTLYAFAPKGESVATIQLTVPKTLSFGVPSDGYIHLASEKNKRPLEDLLVDIGLRKGGLETNLSLFDIAQLYLVLKTTRTKMQEEGTVSEQGTVDKTILLLLSDQKLAAEGQTIALVNATGVAGVGRKLEQALTAIGGTVISVKTAKDIQTATTISAVTNGYTTKRLAAMLDTKSFSKSDRAVSDILITIGSDLLKHPLIMEN